DPVLTRHKLDAGRGDAGLAVSLAALGNGQDRQVLLEVIIALGRLHWEGAPDWLRRHLGTPDAALAHAAMQTLRRSGTWPASLKLLDEPSAPSSSQDSRTGGRGRIRAPSTHGADATGLARTMRVIALRAVAERYEPEVVDGLLQRLETETESARRREY